MNSVTGMLSAKRHQAEAVLFSNGQRNCRGPNLIAWATLGAAVIALLGIAPPAAADPASGQHWVGTWGASPSDGATAFSNQTIRLIVHTSVGGNSVTCPAVKSIRAAIAGCRFGTCGSQQCRRKHSPRLGPACHFQRSVLRNDPRWRACIERSGRLGRSSAVESGGEHLRSGQHRSRNGTQPGDANELYLHLRGITPERQICR